MVVTKKEVVTYNYNIEMTEEEYKKLVDSMLAKTTSNTAIPEDTELLNFLQANS